MVLAKLIDYYDFIIDSDENLNRRIFDSNVRDYLGLNPVNADIMKSLADSDNPEFWWFNNGITIIVTQYSTILAMWGRKMTKGLY